MKKIIISGLLLLSFFNLKAQNNTLWEAKFWKNNPTIDDVNKEINNGNSAVINNDNSFDAVTFAILNNANNDVIINMIEMPGNGIDKKTHHSRSYLHWAAAAGNLELVKYLIQKGSDVNYKDSKGATIISYAASNGNKNIDVYNELFNAGVDPKKLYQNDANLIMLIAPFDTNLEITNYLISKGLNIKHVDEYNRNATDYAARLGNIEIINQFIKKGIKPTDQALFFATQGSRQVTNGLDFYKFLIDKLKLDPNATNPEGQTLLHNLVRKPNTELIQYMIDKKVDVNKVDSEGNNALMKLASTNNIEVAKLILGKTKNINAQNVKGLSALSYAVESGSFDMFSLLIDHNADINLEDKEGRTLAYYLYKSAKDEKTNSKNNNQESKTSSPFQMKFNILKNKKMNFSKPQKDGSNVYHYAVENQNPSLIYISSKLDANINQQDSEGMTALHKAALTAKDNSLLKKLVDLGADTKIKNEMGETPLDIAKENEYLKQKNISLDFLN